MTTLATMPTSGGGASRDALACAHCGLALPRSLPTSALEPRFCCSGCAAAYGMIESCGLGAYYTLLAQAPDLAHARQGKSQIKARFEEYDDDIFVSSYARDAGQGLKYIELVLEGLHCAACVWLLERLPRLSDGIASATVQLGRSSIGIVYDPVKIRLSRVAELLATLGYVPHPPREQAVSEARRADDRRRIVRIAVAGACTGNVMLFAFALYGGFLGGEGTMSAAHTALFRWLSLAAGLLCLIWPGAEFFRNAAFSLRTRAPSIDLPIALALTAGGVMGLVNTLCNRGEIYFDSLTMLVFLLLVGRFLGGRQQRAAVDSMELLYCLMPRHAIRVDPDGTRARLPIEAVRVGDLLEVLPGDCVPVDGLIERGASSLDQALLTGESRPVVVREGAFVLAGTINLTGVIHVRTKATGRQTRAGRLTATVERCAQHRPRIVQLADAIARPFTAVVLAVAVGTLLAWWASGPASAIDHAVSLLIVTCPCALGLAAPLAVGVAVGRAAKQGILIKGGDIFERVCKPGIAFLDKTGTLTDGRFVITGTAGDVKTLAMAAALERQDSHSIARAISEEFPGGGFVASEMKRLPFGGITGTVDGSTLVVGNESLIQNHHYSRLPQDVAHLAQAAKQRGETVVFVAVDGAIRSVISLGNRLKDDAGIAVQSLRRLGWHIRVLSGDAPEAVWAVADQLGIDRAECVAGVSPEDKARMVQESLSSGPVLMIGDGVNDAAALASATVGIATQGGAEASLTAADVYIARPGLAPIVELLRAGPRVMRTVRRIFAVSLLYNVAAGYLAVAGLIHPIIAAVLMPLASLSVIAIAVGSRPFGRQSTTGRDAWK